MVVEEAQQQISHCSRARALFKGAWRLRCQGCDGGEPGAVSQSLPPLWLPPETSVNQGRWLELPGSPLPSPPSPPPPPPHRPPSWGCRSSSRATPPCSPLLSLAQFWYSKHPTGSGAFSSVSSRITLKGWSHLWKENTSPVCLSKKEEEVSVFVVFLLSSVECF